MKAEQIMTTEVSVVHVDTTVDEVVRILTTRRISSVPVVDDEYHILGVVGEDEFVFERKGDSVFSRKSADVVSQVSRLTAPGG